MTLDVDSAIAVTRFGLGAKADEIARARADPRGYLTAQIRPTGAPLPWPGGPGSDERLDDLGALQQARTALRRSGGTDRDQVKVAAMQIRAEAGADFLARVRLGATTQDAFTERWALFWANHFTVSALKPQTAGLIGPFEAEAIRPHVFGRFEDMLVASTQHPAMLLYLDQVRSVGPNSLLAQRARRSGKTLGLNENLGREAMELHTVGVDAGYTQSDVTEFAKALTGWSLGRANNGEEPRGYMFRPFAHEPGARTIMGRRYAEGGEDQALAVLRDLAANPHTANHLAFKIGRHFINDNPPPTLTARLARTYLASDGRLDMVARALIASPEAWSPGAVKFKTPYEFLVSSWRATGDTPDQIQAVARTMTTMGQKPFSAPSPEGWPEAAQAWCDPDGVIKRMAWSEGYAEKVVGQRDPAMLAQNALGARLGPLSAKTIGRAETRSEGLSILLMSPEFLRR